MSDEDPHGLPTIDFYLDFVSPYAWLAFDRLPQALQGLSYRVRYRPVLLGALFQARGQGGPADVPAKHAWLMRHTAWLAAQQGTPLQWPAVHPFAPLPLLRLALACRGDAQPEGVANRFVCETLFRHAWCGDGARADDPARLAALAQALPLARPPEGEAVKAELRAQTAAASARGVFGLPALMLGERLFWGLEALPMLRAQIEGGAARAALDALWSLPDRVAKA